MTARWHWMFTLVVVLQTAKLMAASSLRIKRQAEFVNGKWTLWGSWTECKNGAQERYRECTNPAAANGDQDCEGSAEDSQECNSPINGGWSECESSPCERGTCTDQENGYICTCEAGFTGTHCGIDIDECESSPCERGTCTNQENGYICTCLAGFTGTHCGTDIDECESSPCERGTCTDQENGCICKCEAGFTGTHCEIEKV